MTDKRSSKGKRWAGTLDLNTLTAEHALERARFFARKKGRMLHFEPGVVSIFEVPAAPVLLKIWEHDDPAFRARQARRTTAQRKQTEAERVLWEQSAIENQRAAARARWLTPAYRVAFARDLRRRGVIAESDLKVVETQYAV